MRALILLPLIIVGCAPPDDSMVGAIYGIDSTFNKYYQAFDAQYGTNVNIAIGFVPQVSPTIGRCMQYSNGYRQIVIDPTYWAQLSEDAKTVLIFHELGHCVFNRLHNWQTFGDGCPLSIMQANNFGDPCYQMHQADYAQELPNSELGDHL